MHCTIRSACRLRATSVLLVALLSWCGGAKAELVVLVPLAAGNQPVLRAGPEGEPHAPVLKRAPNDNLSQAIAREAARGTIKFLLELDQHAQRIVGAAQPASSFLLVAKTQGGFARRGFWLADAKSNLVWHADPYIDMALDRGSVDDGSFEEEFAHELGHVLLRRLIPRLPNGMSRVAHSSLAITDYPTAFDEGFAIHMQGLARQLTQNAKLKALDRGMPFKPFLPYWHSHLDRSLRLQGMRGNLFIHRQLPDTVNVGDATALFDLAHFKNGQQMLSSEGVLATLFYHLQLANTDTATLAERYRSLLVSLRALHGQKLISGTPLFMNLVNAHVQRVPTDRARWLSTVLELTYGATAGNLVLRDLTKLSVLGQEGREEFAAALKQARAALAELTAQVARSPARLGAALGPELWLASKQGEAEVTLNLNTAEKANILAVLGMESGDADLLLANRATQGPFADVADVAKRRSLPPLWRQRLQAARDLAVVSGEFQRE
jgi:DNA uptake protein ComE-like DNA-binding protein